MTERKEFKYEIGGKSFVMRRLVLGQIEQLSEAIADFTWPAELELTITNVIRQIGSKLGIALAIVLTEEGKSPGEDKDLEALAREIKFGLDEETTLRIGNDFFALNPDSSLLKLLQMKLSELIMKLSLGIPAAGLSGSSSSSPEETLPSGSGSAGAIR